MTDYTKAFREGLAAAIVAERARKEINSVFLELNSQLSEATEGKIAIDRKEYEVREAGLFSLWSFSSPKQKETYWAIAAYNPSASSQNTKQLAKWEQDHAGYPCKIISGKKETICEDKEALESSLADLLQDPLTGEKLQILIQLEVCSLDQEKEPQGKLKGSDESIDD